jgi:hypothetical protein
MLRIKINDTKHFYVDIGWSLANNYVVLSIFSVY